MNKQTSIQVKMKNVSSHEIMDKLPPSNRTKLTRSSTTESMSPKHHGRLSASLHGTPRSTRKSLEVNTPRRVSKSKSPIRQLSTGSSILDETSVTEMSSFCIHEEKKEDETVGPGSEFHDVIEERDWGKLEAMMKKYDYKYWKKIRQKMEQQKREEMASSPTPEEQEEGKEDEEEKEENESDEGKEKDKDKDEDEQQEEQKEESAATPSPPPSPGGFRRSLSRMSPGSIRRSLSPGSLRRSKALVKLRAMTQFGSQRRLEKERQLVPPLLIKDQHGRTPLHLAMLNKCPEKILLQLIVLERTAAGVQDKFGQTALHMAVRLRHHDHVLEKTIKAFPNALKTKDLQGRSPIGLGVELAREMQDEESPEDPDQPFYWGNHPFSPEEEDWQYKQEKIWNKVNFLLKDLMKRNKCVIPSEHGLILEALEGGAPPKLINRFISTADKYLMADDDLAGSAIALCVKRQYRLDTLEYLLENCRERTTMIIDYTHKALVTHYRFGCRKMKKGVKPFGKELIDLAKERSEQQLERKNSRDEGDEGKDEKENSSVGSTAKIDDGITPLCSDWWEILKHIIFYCAYGKAFKSIVGLEDDHLLHAGLAIAATPPSLLQLILAIYPDSRPKICPVFKALPIHIMCTRWKHDILHKEQDVTMERVIKHFLKPERELITWRHRGRLPIHLALDVGQAWSFLKPFVAMDKKSVGMRDPVSKLFPFQMAAVKASTNNIAMFLRNQYTPGEWRVIPTHEKREEYMIAEAEHSNRQLGTIFELLRRHPDAVAGKVLSRDAVFSRDLEDVGPVAKHYLLWVYGRGSRGWKLRPANVKLLRDSIINANISKPLVPWWERMKTYIWKCSNNDALPHTDEYLLHAALYNPDTPPLVIELLLELFPMSAAKTVPNTEIYPLHIAAATRPYHPQPFEIPNRMDSLRLTLFAYKPAARLTHHGRLPLHICIARGKTWQAMRPLVQQYRQSLSIIDPQTGLAPFQLMSIFKITSKEHMLRFSNIAARQARAADMDSMPVQERALFLKSIKKNQDLSVLTAIYELLKNGPNAIYALGRPSGDSGSIVCEELLEEEEEDVDDVNNRSSVIGVAASLDKFLQDLQKSPTRRDSVRNYILTPQKERRTLGSFLQQDDGARHLITPGSARPSLSSFLGTGMGTSARSLVSRSSGILHDDYVKPNYDDDVMSSMGASMSSFMSPSVAEDGSVQFPSSMSSSSSQTPNSSRARRRGRRPSSPMRNNSKAKSKLPIALPDLDKD